MKPSMRKFINAGLAGLLLSCGSEPTAPTQPPQQKPPTQQQNRAPVIISSCLLQINERARYECGIQASDPDGDVLNYNLEGPSWLYVFSNVVTGNSPEVKRDTIFPIKIKVSDGKLSTEQKYDLTVNDISNAYLLTKDQVNSIVSVQDSSISFSDPTNFVAGDIIASLVNDKFPDGALKLVSTVSPDQKIIGTTQASLEQAVKQASLSYTTDLSPSQIQGFSGLPGMFMSPSLNNAFKFGISMNNVVLYDRDGDLNTTYDQVILDGNISFNTGFNFDLSIKNFTLEKLLFQNTTTDVANLTVGSNFFGFSSLGKVTIAEYKFAPITIGYLPTFIPVPVIITPILAVEADIGAAQVNPLSISVRQEATLTTKIGYENGWTASADFSNNFSFSNPVATGDWNLTVGVGPVFKAPFYGVAGLYTGESNTLRLSASAGDWKLFGGLNAFIGAYGKVPVFGKKAIAYAKNVITYEKLLAQKGGTETNEKILFHSRKEYDPENYNGLYIMNTNGSNIEKIPNSSYPAPVLDYASWSPDGTKITFVSNKEGNEEIYTTNIDGSDIKRLTNNPKRDLYPNWSPDGQEILFVSNKRTKYPQYTGDGIWIMNADGTNQKELNTPYPYGQHDFASWSPDGKKIIYSVQGSNDGCSICIINPDGTGPSVLVNRSSLGGRDGYFPHWSPDGSRVIFETTINGNKEIYVVNSDGIGLKNLTNNPALDVHPSWSRDGTQIVFISNRGELEYNDIYLMNADGTNPKKLFGDYFHNSNPVWSPVQIK